MGLFWKRKNKDQFVSLGLNEPRAAPVATQDKDAVAVTTETVSGPPDKQATTVVQQPLPEPTTSTLPIGETPKQKAAPSPSPFQTSVLGLNLSMEELQAQEAALEQEFSARFRRAVAATRESLSERIDTVFAGAKQIDATLLDELEEALIAADIGVPTTMHVLETVRRGISRKEIDDIDKLKASIKSELL